MSQEAPQFAPVTARRVAEDVAEWWIRALLQNTNVHRLQEVMEAVLPGLHPIAAQSPLAAELKLLSLWQEVLLNTHLEGDFSMLQDKFLLLVKDFGKSQDTEECMKLLKMHDAFCHFYKALREGRADTDGLQQYLQSLYLEQELPEEVEALLQPDGEIEALQNQMEALVASNASEESSEFKYDTLRDKMQIILLQWIENGFDKPILVQLGYHMGGIAPASSTAPAIPSAISTPAAFVPRRGPDVPQTAPVRRINSARDSLRQGAPMSEGAWSKEDQRRKRAASGEPSSIVPIFELPERSAAADDESTNSSEATAEASNVSVEANRRDSELIWAEEPDNPRRGSREEGLSSGKRRRSKYEKAPILASPSDHGPLLTQPPEDDDDSSSQPPRTFSFDDDDEDEAIVRILKKKRKVLNPLSPLTKNPSSNSKRREGATPLAENLSPNSSARSKSSSFQHRRRRRHRSKERRPSSLDNETLDAAEKLRIAALALQGRTKRRPFTGKENDAIAEGVARFGSDFVAIRQHFVQTLHGRTVLSIRDRARALMKKGKIDPALFQQEAVDV